MNPSSEVDGRWKRRGWHRLVHRKDGTPRLFLRKGKKWRPLVPKPVWLLMSAADIITLMNFVCGIMSIMYSIDGGRSSGNEDSFKVAMMLILAGVIFDGIDGPAARKFGSSHRFGKWLDSFADAVTFCIAPAFLIYNLFSVKGGGVLDGVQSLLSIVGAFSIAILGILRLARFSLSGYKFPDFIGMPTPAMAILAVSFCGIYFWSDVTGWASNGLMDAMGIGIPLVMIIGALAMVADMRFRRFRGKPMIALGLATLVFIGATVLGIWIPMMGMIGSLIGAFAATSYLLSPLMAGPDNLWGAAARMERELEEEGLLPENLEDEGGIV